MRHRQTPSQTVGPFFAYGLTPEQYGYLFAAIARPRLVDDDTPGERIRVTGRVLDGEGRAIEDAMIEAWQADAEGRYPHPADERGAAPGFRGFGRCGTGTDPGRRFVFHTIKPGPIGDGQAPHLSLVVLMRGLLSHAYTRLYFADEARANAACPVLSAVDPARRGTLIASRSDTPAGPTYHLDIHMQGDAETVFFDV